MKQQKLLMGLAAMCLTLEHVEPVRAQGSQTSVDSDTTPSPSTTSAPAAVTRVRWDERWRRVAAWEYVVTFGTLSGALAVRAFGPEPPDNWRGGILFDDFVMERVEVEDPSMSGHVSTMTDVLYFGSMGYRLIDTVVVPWAGYADPDLALQMAMIDLESFALVAGVMFGTQLFVGRQRPEYDRTCDGSASARELERCQQHGSRFRSFIAGHPATVLTAAGLTCTHHQHVPLYGGGWGDTLACGLMLGAAAATGAGRVMAGKHYPSDLILGLGLGAVAGWVMPRALHYGFSGDPVEPEPTAGNASGSASPFTLVALYPQLHTRGAQLNAAGVF